MNYGPEKVGGRGSRGGSSPSADFYNSYTTYLSHPSNFSRDVIKFMGGQQSVKRKLEYDVSLFRYFRYGSLIFRQRYLPLIYPFVFIFAKHFFYAPSRFRFLVSVFLYLHFHSCVCDKMNFTTFTHLRFYFIYVCFYSSEDKETLLFNIVLDTMLSI